MFLQLLAFALGLIVGIVPLLPALLSKRERPTRGDYIWMGALTLIMASLFAFLVGHSEASIKNFPAAFPSPWIILAVFCLVYCVTTTWLTFREIDCLVPDIADTGVFEQGFWTTCQGAFFFSSLTGNDVDFVPASELLKGPRAFSLFGGHNSPILLLLLPFYWLHRSPRTLVVLQSLALSVAPLMLYLAVVDYVGEWPALLLAVAFALSGPMLGSSFLGWHEMSFAVVPLLLAYHFFSTDAFWPFVIAILICCLSKESIALTIFLFAPVALFRGYTLPWILAPALISIAWFVLSLWVIIPYFGRGRAYVFFGHHYNEIGGSLKNILRTCILRPWVVLRVLLRKSGLKYLYQLLFAYGLLLPFGDYAAILSLAGFAQVLLADGTQYTLPYKYYSLEAIIFITIGFAATLGKLDAVSPANFPLVLAISIASLVLTINGFILWSRGILWSQQKGSYFRRRPTHDALLQMLRRIPPDAAALVPLSLVTFMAHRIRLGQESWNYEQGASRQYEYVVLDHNDQWRFGRHDKMKHQWLCEEVAGDPEVELIYEQDNVQLFRFANYQAPVIS
jgi:uncharacterized membrane protein